MTTRKPRKSAFIRTLIEDINRTKLMGVTTERIFQDICYAVCATLPNTAVIDGGSDTHLVLSTSGEQ